MELTSTAFVQGGAIPSRYTCDGGEVLPPLAFGGVPEGTRSLALIMEDPDAPRGVWDHWVVFDIPPTTREVKEGECPEGVRGRNTLDTLAYEGPCPHSGRHCYVFKLFALDMALGLSEGVTKQEVLGAMEGHVLAAAELMGFYERKR